MIELLFTVLIATSEGLTCLYSSRSSEAVIQWCLLKYKCALKWHPNVKTCVNYGLLFRKHNICLVLLDWTKDYGLSQNLGNYWKEGLLSET